MLNYAEIRPQLKTGDLIAIDTRNRFTRGFQYLFGHKQYAHMTHCGILVWRGDRLMVCEMDGRCNVERPLSQYVAEYDCLFFRPANLPESAFIESIDKHLNLVIHYDAMDFIRVGFRVVFGLIVKDNPDRILCTEFATRIYNDAGCNLFNGPILQPKEMCERAGPILFSVQRGHL
jgi:hypothetical protein